MADRAASGTLGLVAGAGDLPRRLVDLCQAEGRAVFVLALEGHTDPAVTKDVAHAWTRLGAAASALPALKQAGVQQVVMAGPVKRPSWSELRPDLKTAQFLAKVGARSFGDNALLDSVVRELEREGFQVLGVDDLLGHLLAKTQTYSERSPDPEAEADIQRGITVAKALGAVDVGQAVVVQQGLVLAVEALEGTDGLLERVGPLKREGPGGVLVKVKKPGQEHRADLPTIGVATVEAAAAAGLRGLAVEAGGALVVDPDVVRATADRLGLFVVGIAVAEQET